MKHLITGGAGFIGSHLADALVARGDELLILDDLSTGSKENLAHLLSNGRVELVEGSVLDHLLVDDLMQEADACFHLASAVGVSLIVERPLETLLQNVRGADVVTATAAQRESRLVFTSTSEIYGKNSHGGLSENADRVLGSPSTSRWTYATAKSLGEMLAYGYHRERAAETVVVRLFNTVGPRQTGAYGMVLPRFVRQALAGEELTVYGDGTQSRCFIHVHDAVDALQHVAGSDEALGNAYNIGCPNEITILRLAEKVIERAGSSSGLRFVPFAEAYGGGFEELGRRKADTSALERLTGWRPRRTIDDAIDDTIAYQQRLLARELVA